LTPSQFPTTEDDEFEFKSSQTADVQIKTKLSVAASAFANSGGGCFIWGVNGNGDPDDGVSAKQGRQDMRDWIDNLLHQAEPTPKYSVETYSDNKGRGSLETGKVIAAVSIHPSPVAPHMAPDKKYYFRAGAHSVPAGHYIVEGIRALRQIDKPILKHILRESPFKPSTIQLGLVALTDAPAINVQLTIEALLSPRWGFS
jgi:predicted HTH transcriptional regulator